nr:MULTISPECIES: lytic transglycosylase domain-containing protein [unclassified Bradyrhizobium]
MLDRYGSPGVFAAYNAGPSRYEEHLAGGPLPIETQAYVATLANLLGIELPPTWTVGRQSPAAATLFVTRSDLMKTRDRSPALMPSSGATTAISVRDVSPMVPRPMAVFSPRWNSGVSQ